MKTYCLADYATFKILSGLDPNSEGFTPKSRYYKAIYLLDLNLKRNHKIDIQLPWRWYIYGPVVELDCIDRDVYRLDPQTGDVDDEFRSKLMFGNEPKADAPLEVIRAVDYEVGKICDRHPSVMELVDQSYKTAELPFIQILKKYDDNISSNFVHYPADSKAVMKCDTLRLELSRHYPIKRYPEMHGPILRILELIRKVRDQRSNELINPIECSFKSR